MIEYYCTNIGYILRIIMRDKFALDFLLKSPEKDS